MDCNNTDFDTWFDTLCLHVLDSTGVTFTDQDSVREDYDNGRDVHDVIEEICAEYKD